MAIVKQNNVVFLHYINLSTKVLKSGPESSVTGIISVFISKVSASAALISKFNELNHVHGPDIAGKDLVEL